MEDNETQYIIPISDVNESFLKILSLHHPDIGFFLNEADGFAKDAKENGNKITFLTPKKEKLTLNFVFVREILRQDNKMNESHFNILKYLRQKIQRSDLSKEEFNGTLLLQDKCKREKQMNKNYFNNILARTIYYVLSENQECIKFQQRIISPINKNFHLFDETWLIIDKNEELYLGVSFYLNNQNQKDNYIHISNLYQPINRDDIIKKLMNALLLDIYTKEIKFKFIDLTIENDSTKNIIVKWANENKFDVCLIFKNNKSYIKIFLNEVNKE